MGEFGFITADDVYHVTVYATDENGNFKIVSMKNIKLMKGPPPQSFTTVTSTTSTTPQPFMVKTTAKSEVTTPPSSDEPACASCRLPSKPDTATIKPSLSSDATTDAPPPFKVVSKDDQITTEAPTTPQADALPQKIINENRNQGNILESRFGDDGSDFDDNSKNQQPQNMNNNQNINSIPNQSQNPSSNQASPRDRQPALYEKLNSPKMFNKNAGNVEHYNRMENLMNGLLYRFDYSTEFQGHREEGDRLGNKEGEYYSVGRDNIKRIVSYKANEFGYMPFIRQEPLNPQELQYYDERNNRLRGYKFEWFYP